MPYSFLRGDEDAGDVNSDHSFVGFESDVLDRPPEAQPGIVDKNVDAAEGRYGLCHGGPDGVRIADVGCDRDSLAARRLALTPAAVSRNVAMLERNLGVRLFQRSTRKLVLTEAGEGFLQSIGGNLEALQAAIADASSGASEPVGVLKVSLSPTFGVTHILPLLPEFLRRYPLIRPEWHFENRSVDLVTEGYDVAIGGGFDLAPGIVARTLAPAHIIAVASPTYIAERSQNANGLDGIALASLISQSLNIFIE